MNWFWIVRILRQYNGIFFESLSCNITKFFSKYIVYRLIENLVENCLFDFCFLGFNEVKMSLKRRKRNSVLHHLRTKRRIRSTSETVINSTISYPVTLKSDDEPSSSTQNNSDSNNNYENLKAKPDCMHPEYVVYTWVLSMIALATVLKLYYLIKLLLAILMVALYTVLIVLPSYHIFNEMIGSKREPE